MDRLYVRGIFLARSDHNDTHVFTPIVSSQGFIAIMHMSRDWTWVKPMWLRSSGEVNILMRIRRCAAAEES